MANIDLEPSGPTELIKAIIMKDMDQIKELLKDNPVTDTDDCGNTPIHWVCFNKNKDDIWDDRCVALGWLLDNLAPELVDMRNLKGNTPFILAVASGLQYCMKMLLEKGADIQACGQNEILPLTIPCVTKDIRTITFLIGSGAKVNSKNRSGETVLHQVLKYWLDNTVGPYSTVSSVEILKHKELEKILEILVFNGADVNSETHPQDCGGGEMPLHVAAEYGRSSAIDFLLNHGAFVDEAPADRHTPLMSAVWNGHMTTAKILVNSGANMSNIMVNGNSVLHAACSVVTHRLVDLSASLECVPLTLNSRNVSGKQNCVKYILRSNPIHLNLRNDLGMTPLMCAAMTGLRMAVLDLIAAGATISEVDNNGKTALHHACMPPHNELVIHDVIDSLISKGADVNVTDILGDTPLHYLCRRRLSEEDQKNITAPSNTVDQLCTKRPSFFILLTNGANINAKGQYGDTPLHVACSYDNNLDVVKILLIMGAVVDEENDDGKLAKDLVYVWNRSYFETIMQMGKANRKSTVQNDTSQGSVKHKRCIVM